MANPALSRLLLSTGLTLSMWAQAPASAVPPAEAAAVDPVLGRSTPRGTVVNFLRSISSEDYARASKYLQTQLPAPRAERLAMELGTVMNRRFQLDVERVSNLPGGNPGDDTQPNQELIGVIQSTHGPVEVALERVRVDGTNMVWLFSAETLKEVPQLYQSTDSFWLEAYVPDQLKERHVLGAPVWRWLFWMLGLAIAWGGSAVLQSLLRFAWPPILRRLDPGQSHPLTLSLSGPLRVFLFALLVMFLSSFAATILSRQFWFRVGATVAVFSGGWLLSRTVDALAAIAANRLQRQTGASQSSTIWLAQRAGKIAIGMLGLLCLLRLVDFELTGVLAGLGIGGLAFAFAAQKTIENLFGGVMITTDRSIRVGDTCRVGDVTGTIIDIGIRSTRIRTEARTIVSIPNGQTAAVSIENFTDRDKFFCRHVIGVRYETDAAAMRGVLEAIRKVLAGHSIVEKSSARVRFIAFSPSSLDIELRVYLFATNYDDFLARQEELLLLIMETLAARGVGVAFPSQTLYVAKEQ